MYLERKIYKMGGSVVFIRWANISSLAGGGEVGNDQVRLTHSSSTYLAKEAAGGHLLSEDDLSHWAPPYWNVTKETFS